LISSSSASTSRLGLCSVSVWEIQSGLDPGVGGRYGDNQAESQVRRGIAADLHDDIGSNLTRFVVLCIIMR
jgi:hypothetical protein